MRAAHWSGDQWAADRAGLRVAFETGHGPRVGARQNSLPPPVFPTSVQAADPGIRFPSHSNEIWTMQAIIALPSKSHSIVVALLLCHLRMDCHQFDPFPPC